MKLNEKVQLSKLRELVKRLENIFILFLIVGTVL